MGGFFSTPSFPALPPIQAPADEEDPAVKDRVAKAKKVQANKQGRNKFDLTKLGYGAKLGRKGDSS